MADEPAIPASRVSDAHDAMEGQPDPSCFSLSESGVSMRNGTTETFKGGRELIVLDRARFDS